MGRIKNDVSRAYWEKSLEDMMRIYDQTDKSLSGIRRMIANAVEMIDEYDRSKSSIVVKKVYDDDEDCDVLNRIDNAIEYMRSINRTNQSNIWKEGEPSFGHDEVVESLPPQHLESFAPKKTPCESKNEVPLTNSWNTYPKPLYYNKIDYAVEDYVAWKWHK
jgi:hypothetical protein